MAEAQTSALSPRMKKHYEDVVRPAMIKEFGYKNVMEVPTIEKIVINMGVGEATADRKKVDNAAGSLLLGATLAASAVFGYVGALQIETHPTLFGRDQPIGTRGLEPPLMAASPRSETSVRSGLGL